MEKFQVYILQEAADDLFNIHEYISKNDSLINAEKIQKELKEICLSLEEMPNGGNYPQELIKIAVTNYRELHFKPYRIIYQVIGKKVYIHCILDGRRDMVSLLMNRLLFPD